MPLAVLVGAARRADRRAARRRTAAAEQRAAGARMLRVFAPQLPLYGVGIVLTGVLQAHRRFAWPVLAPLLSSLTVIGAYLVFAAVAGPRADRRRRQPGRRADALPVGTTLGVVVLSLCLLIPLRRLRLRLRPGVRASRPTPAPGRRLAAGRRGHRRPPSRSPLLVASTGRRRRRRPAPVVYNLAQTVYLLPWAVLAVPLATAAYPTLAAAPTPPATRTATGATLAPAVAAVLLLSCLGAAALVAAGRPGRPRSSSATGPGGPAAAGIAGVRARACSATGCSRCSPGPCTPGASPGRRPSRPPPAGRSPPPPLLLARGAAAAADRVLARRPGQLGRHDGARRAAGRRRAPRGPGRARWPALARAGAAGCSRRPGRGSPGGAGALARAAGRRHPDAPGALVQGMLCGVVVGVVFSPSAGWWTGAT